jgi:hypothetical protein
MRVMNHPVHNLKGYSPCTPCWDKGGNRVTAPLNLNSSTKWKQVATFIPQLLYCWVKNTYYPCIGDRICPRASLDTLKKRKICLQRNKAQKIRPIQNMKEKF